MGSVVVLSVGMRHTIPLAILATLATLAVARSYEGRGDVENYDSFSMDGASNCQCSCNCQFSQENPCNMDFIIVLDAASCVRNVWQEMLLRINSLARGVTHNHPMGSSSRFSVITYAEKAQVKIGLDENLTFEEFSKKLDGLSTINQGSFLDQG